MLTLNFVGSVAVAGEHCWYDPDLGDIVCQESGGGRVGTPPRPPPEEDPPTTVPPAPLRYVYLDTDALIGDCYYWSNVPGGIDSTDASNTARIDAIVATLPRCPSTAAVVSDPSVFAWSIFRSWSLAAPSPSVTPPDHGITGIASHVSAVTPDVIAHTETMPDGRVLEVKARPVLLTIDWGDGAFATHDPADAVGYPSGSATHMYDLKTCSGAYRAEHPSGGLCHPTAEWYPITVGYRWEGEYNVGSGWVTLGTLDRVAQPIAYDVDEARGVPTS